MPNFGYVGKHASQSRTANTGVFDTDEINYLLQEAEWKLQDLAGEYIVVAGGGGGGAGGMLLQDSDTFHFKPNIDYAVSIGSGGSGGYNGGGGNGGTSSLEIDDFAGGKTTISTSGGGAGRDYYNVGAHGGSGGGNGSRAQNNRGLGISGQGNDGRLASSDRVGGGGGGKGSGGGTGTSGGSGLANDITGASVTYAEGRFTNGQGSNANGSSGTANRGMGGSGTNRENRTAGSGGSGVVIVTVPTGRTVTIGSGLTGTTNTVGDKQVVSLTAGSGNLTFA